MAAVFGTDVAPTPAPGSNPHTFIHLSSVLLKYTMNSFTDRFHVKNINMLTSKLTAALCLMQCLLEFLKSLGFVSEMFFIRKNRLGNPRARADVDLHKYF